MKKKKALALKPQPKHAFELPDGTELMAPGGQYGFTKRGDSIKLAPMLLDEHREICSQLDGVNALLEATNRFVMERHTEIQRNREKWWVEVRQTLGLMDYPDEASRLVIQGEWAKLRPKEEAPDARKSAITRNAQA